MRFVFMIKLTNNLIRLFEEEKSMLIEFVELTNGGKYSNSEIYNITNKLQMLAGAEIIIFSSTDGGFKIEILNMGELIEIHETLELISTTDQETKNFLNQVAIEIKGKTKIEARAIINRYSDKIPD